MKASWWPSREARCRLGRGAGEVLIRVLHVHSNGWCHVGAGRDGTLAQVEHHLAGLGSQQVEELLGVVGVLGTFGTPKLSLMTLKMPVVPGLGSHRSCRPTCIVGLEVTLRQSPMIVIAAVP